MTNPAFKAERTECEKTTKKRQRMEAFVNTDNQTLLWEIIQGCPVIGQVPQADRWFATHIGHVYETATPDKTLLELNETALWNMVQDLVHFVKQSQPSQPSQSSQSSGHDLQPQETRHQEMGQRVDQDTNLRNQATKDEPIKNMEELLAETQKMRERDLPRFAVPTGDKVD